MKLTPEQDAVLSIFKAHGIDRGQYLPIQTLNRERIALPQKVQDAWDDILKSLMRLGYIAYDPLGYGLTEMGYNYIHTV